MGHSRSTAFGRFVPPCVEFRYAPFASRAHGVGHVRTASRSVVPALLVQPSARAVDRRDPRASAAVAVGQSLIAAPRLGFPRAYLRVSLLASAAVAVGHSRCAFRIASGKLAPRVSVSSRFQVAPRPASDARAVGHSGCIVRDDEEPVASVRGADVGGSEQSGVTSITKPFKVADNGVQPARNERRNVFDADDPRPRFFDDARVLAPESGTIAVEPGTEPGPRDVLAWEASTHEIDRRESCASDRTDIIEPHSVGEVAREHGATERVDLDLVGDGRRDAVRGETPKQAKLEHADAGEERTDADHAAALSEAAAVGAASRAAIHAMIGVYAAASAFRPAARLPMHTPST